MRIAMLGKNVSSTMLASLVATAVLGACVADDGSDANLGEDSAELGCPGHCPDLGPLRPATVPAALQPPASASLRARYYATGSQIYTCQATPTGGYAWTFKAPDAILFDRYCEPVVTHGAGPFWRWNADGSTVVARKLADAPAPAAGAVPWVLLAATSNTPGRFGEVTFVQRLDTHGGVAPTTGCDARHVGRDRAVPYTAVYYFWTGGGSAP